MLHALQYKLTNNVSIASIQFGEAIDKYGPKAQIQSAVPYLHHTKRGKTLGRKVAPLQFSPLTPEKLSAPAALW